MLNVLGSDSPTRPSLTLAEVEPDNVDDSSVPSRLKGKLYPSRELYTDQVKSYFLHQMKASNIIPVSGNSKRIRVECNGHGGAKVEATQISSTKE